MTLEAERFINLYTQEFCLRYRPHYIIKEKYTQVFIEAFALPADNDQLRFVAIEFYPPFAAPSLNVIDSTLYFANSQHLIAAATCDRYVISKLELASSSLVSCG